ncbi:VOC family protein [Pseudonocardia phyllosphaerae]|uniref:VOC family protein n=1 Tax=Pseudonocardia phyllosphaerae TaxID=3390502 RepID=UPI00397A3964
MAMRWEQVVVDATDPVRLGRWWAEALDWVVVNPSPREFEIRPPGDTAPGLIFVAVREHKRGKNRLHIDLRPDGVRDSEVARLLMLGATRRDVGQRAGRHGDGPVTWTVLADPEGNEFCVLGEEERRS